MKYKLLKDLPLAKIGTEVEFFPYSNDEGAINIILESEFHKKHIADINKKDIPEWLEEVKEHKTIYDINIGDFHYFLDIDGEIRQVRLYDKKDIDILSDFLTEQEAKRNKLLRELATRTDKWLPIVGDNYYSYHLTGCDSWNWQGDNTDMIKYHSGLVFRNEEEYNKYMTEETKDLLFKI